MIKKKAQVSIMPKEQSPSADQRLADPNRYDNVILKCPKCRELLYTRDWQRNLKVCYRCTYHFRLGAHERIAQLVDADSFVETDADIESVDVLHFVSHSQVYAEKIKQEQQKIGLRSAILTGYARIENQPLVLGIMDFRYIGGSMGSAVGEKIVRAIELAIQERIPILIASASGGARMQEGLYSLMQMAKTVMALNGLKAARLPYFSLLTDPTTGGVTASFAMLGDVILAEPGSLICFAGPRVIEQFMHIGLPQGAVTAEFVFRHGMIDMVLQRKELRQVIARLLRLYKSAENAESPKCASQLSAQVMESINREKQDGIRLAL